MDCKHTATLVHGYIDHELDDARRSWFEAHLLGCPACARVVAQERALSAALRRAAPRLAAPPALAARIGAALDAAATGTAIVATTAPTGVVVPWRLPRIAPRALRLAASFAAVAVLSSSLTWFAVTRGPAPEDDAQIAVALVDSHVHALMTGHVMVVASSDQHTVKPWFQGRVEVSPPVGDFASNGFPLLGGRVDYVDRRTAAVLVYGSRQHMIDVYVWPQAGAQPAAGAPSEATHNGYNTIRWNAGGLAFAAVSDVNFDELRRLVGLVQAVR
jgi:anti-sigma factor RsiW